MPYWSDTSCEDEDKAIKLFHAYNPDMNQTILPTEEMENLSEGLAVASISIRIAHTLNKHLNLC